MTDIVAFIRARLDEEQAQARDVQLHSPTPWSVADDDSSNIVLCDHDPTHRTDPDEVDRFVAGCEHRQDAEFIAHYNPARVLRGVEAKRAILDEHCVKDDRCRVCTAIHDGRAARFRAPCPTLLALASEWSEHPEYQQEWNRREWKP